MERRTAHIPRSAVTVVVLLIALAARILRAATEPIVNPDVIRFIRQAQELFSNPLAALRDEPYHPLHSLATRIAHDLVTSHLAVDDRFAWIGATKLVGILAGTVIAWLIIRLSRHLGAPWWAAAGAGLLWAVGRRPSSYGADGLSDSLFLMFFGAAILLAMRRRFRPGLHWMAVGGLSGLSYLTRPEGAATVLILGVALAVMSVAAWRRRWRKPLERGTAIRFAPARSVAFMLLGFLAVGGPYMAAIGRFTAKKQIAISAAAQPQAAGVSVADAAFASAGGDVRAIMPLAQIHFNAIVSLGTWRRIAVEIWETFGFAPCLIVGLAMAIKPRLWGRRHWRPLVLVWVFLWLSVMLWLLDRTRTPELPDGYLDGRHTLILEFILHCLFALALQVWMRPMVWWQNFWRSRPLWERLPAWQRSARWPAIFAGIVLALGCLPGAIMLHQPPSESREYLRQAAAWIEANTAPDTVIACSEPTLAYYSHRIDWLWLGKPADDDLKKYEYARDHAIIACMVQTDREPIPPERLGDCTAIVRFDSRKSLHGDVLILYLPTNSRAFNAR